jgi:hypothetical protein
MKFAKDKTTATLIALFLMLTIAVTLVALPTVNAAVTYTYSLVYVGASPLVVGVGQDVLLVTWTAAIPPDIGEQTGLVPGGRQAWYGLTLEVTKPDNTTQSFTIEQSDPVGGGYVIYVPTDVGTYSVQAFFPETWKNTTTSQGWYSSAVSEPVAFTVQEEPVPTGWPESPLTNDYWTRPINSASKDWYVLTGNWLGGAANVWPPGSYGGNTERFAYGLAPESAHILWTRQYYIGGLMDEPYGSTGYQTQHYQGISFSGIIINGVLHYTPRTTAHGNNGWAAVDLYTGETLFYNESYTRPSFAQIYNYESGNQHGGFAYLWKTSGVTLPEIVQVTRVIQTPNNMSVIRTGSSQTVNRTETSLSVRTVWEMLDAWTGNTITYIANVSSGGTAVYGKDGSILRYSTQNYGNTTHPNYYLRVWNASYGTMPSSQYGTGVWQWRPAGGTFGGANAYLGGLAYNYVHNGDVFWSLNVSIPSILGPRNSVYNQTASILAVREDEYVIFGTSGRNDERGLAQGWMMAVSLEPGKEGIRLWESTLTPPLASQATNTTISMGRVYPEDGVITYESSRMLKRWGYDMKTGALLWESEPEVQFNYYGMTENYYEGKLFSFGYGGQIRTYNITTGEILWNYDALTVGTESAYGGRYPIGVGIVADGKLYTVTGEHSPTQPLYRGPNLRCINASNGEEIWKILGFFGGMSPTSYNILMADGILVGLNHFDNQLYAFGKGPSGTTVTASPKTSVYGSNVVVEGTVTDQTPTSRRNINNLLQFSLKGTPAISDEDMSAWMEYLFMNQGRPADAKGVEVVLETLDPNGNFYEIGNTTSDASGMFKLMFTPQVPGEYTIIATFKGSESYWGSHAETAIGVAEAPEPTPAPTPTPAPMTDTYVMGFGIGMIIAIVIVGLLLFLLLRKR